MDHVNAEDFRALRSEYGSRLKLSALIQVTERQIQRWEQGTTRPPVAVCLLLRLLAGDLGALAPAWEGWTVGRTYLQSPRGAML